MQGQNSGGQSVSKEIYGYISVIAAASMWGIGGAVAKSLFNQDISPFMLVKIRLLLSFILLVVGLWIYNPRLLYIPRHEILYFAKLGVFGMAMVQFFYYLTISLTNVGTAVFLQYLSPVLIAMYTVIWEKVKLSWQQKVAVIVATLGGLLIMLDGGGGIQGLTIWGLASGLAAAGSMAFNTIYIKRAVREYHPITAVTYSCGFGALFCWLVMPYTGEVGATQPEQVLMFLYVVVFSTIIPFMLFFLGLRYLSATNVSVTSSLEPVIAAVTAYFALGETMGSLQMIGGVLVLVAVFMLQYNSVRTQQVN